jgi:hypothetical protein
MPVGLDENATTAPPGGAGALRVTVPFIVCPKPTVEESRVMLIPKADTFTVTAPEEIPGADAATVVVPVVLPDVTATLVAVMLAGTVMVEGTDAMVGSKLAKVTT